MKLMHDGKVLIPYLVTADHFALRLLGYMGQPVPPAGHALHLAPCRSIHTFFMRFPIDAIFLDRNLRVVKTVLNLAPWRIAFAPRSVASVIELPAGNQAMADLHPGTVLKFSQ